MGAKKTIPQKPSGVPTFEVPAWVPLDAWAGFVEMRTKIKKPMTRRAMELAVSKLGTLREAGHDPSAVLNQSTLADWQGLFPISTHGGNGNGNRYDKTAGNKAAFEEALRRMEERDRQADLRAEQSDE